MPVLLHGVPQRLPVRVGTVEDLQLASAIIVKPLDTPLARRLAILENHGWLSHCLTSCGGSITQANVAGASSVPSAGSALEMPHLIKTDFILRRSARQRDLPIIAAQQPLNAEKEQAMAIVSLRRAALALLIFWIAVPAALADHSSKARKHPKPASVSASDCCNAPDGRDFLAYAPRSYWRQFDSRRIGP
jgi:hypothetical protein